MDDDIVYLFEQGFVKADDNYFVWRELVGIDCDVNGWFVIFIGLSANSDYILKGALRKQLINKIKEMKKECVIQLQKDVDSLSKIIW